MFVAYQAEEALGIIQVRLFDRGMAAKGTLLRNNKVRHVLLWHCALVATWIDTPSSAYKSAEFSASHNSPYRLEAEIRGNREK